MCLVALSVRQQVMGSLPFIPLHRFSAFWLRSKCSICSYQLNIWYEPHVGSTILNWFLDHGEVLGACSTFAADRAGIAVPPGLVHFREIWPFFPSSFAFNFWSSFMKEDFPFRPSGNRGSGSFVSYPQSSMLFRQPRRSRGSKNARRGGGGKATHVSQPATRGAASRDLKSVPVVEI